VLPLHPPNWRAGRGGESRSNGPCDVDGAGAAFPWQVASAPAAAATGGSAGSANPHPGPGGGLGGVLPPRDGKEKSKVLGDRISVPTHYCSVYYSFQINTVGHTIKMAVAALVMFL
jgi:hypothetical protein